MKRSGWFVLLVGLLGRLPVAHADSAQEAEAAWEKRDQAGERQRAITLWQKAVQEQPSRTELFTRLAQAASSAYRHATNKDEKRRWADLGLHYGREAAEKNPQSAEALARYGEALGQWAQAHKGVKGLHRVKEAVEVLKKSVALDPNHWFSHMLLAEFYREAPASISVGDQSKALVEAKRAVETGPQAPTTHLTLAKTYLTAHQKDAAIQELHAALHAPGVPGMAPETRSDQTTARKMLRDIGAPDAASSSSEAKRPCSDSSECSGACLADPQTVAGDAASGTCSDTLPAAGSCQSTVQKGKVVAPTCSH